MWFGLTGMTGMTGMASALLASSGMQQASINLSQSLHEVYEPDWHGKDDVLSIGKVRTLKM